MIQNPQNPTKIKALSQTAPQHQNPFTSFSVFQLTVKQTETTQQHMKDQFTTQQCNLPYRYCNLTREKNKFVRLML